MRRQLALVKELCRSLPLCFLATAHEIARIRLLVFQSGIRTMIRNCFQVIEALFKAVTYLLILVIGLAMAGLGAYTVIGLAFRAGQFLWNLVLKEPWL